MDNQVPDTIQPATQEADTSNIVVLKFADSRIPEFKETRNKNYIQYGKENNYPEYLNYLFNKSAKHNAILVGKAKYIFGDGFENGNLVINRLGESLNDIASKCILDIEVFGGFYLEVIFNRGGRIGELYHVDYQTIRRAKGTGYYFKENWSKENRDEEEFIEAFDPYKPYGSQIYSYIEYRPGLRHYPLPSYIGANNYIETDIEISKFYLSSIRNGMMPSKMIQFFKGDPSEDKKKDIERRMKMKYSGSENAGNFILVFNDANSVNQTVKVDDLSGSELDKMFVELNKTCQQEIFSGHLITSPMLFGIKTEGQLGGATELNLAYSIFQNTYAKPKSQAFNREINYLLRHSIFAGDYELKATDPIGIQLDISNFNNILPREFVFKKLGVPQELWNSPTVDGAAPAGAAAAPGQNMNDAGANDNIKNLSAKQHQQVMRIIRQYSKGQLLEAAAKALLRTGYGLSEEDINNLLGIEAVQMSAVEDEDDIISVFDSFGDAREDFEILKQKKVCFSSDSEAIEDEAVYMAEAFKDVDVTLTEQRILDLIKKDSKITPKVISEVISQSESYVKNKIDKLIKKGYIETKITTIGVDEVIERLIPEAADIVPPASDKKEPVQIFIKYSYEAKPGQEPVIATTRPFCRKMIQLNRLYSRAEIEMISQRLGYSVWDRKGGWWGKKPECRHRWVSNIVVKKGGKK